MSSNARARLWLFGQIALVAFAIWMWLGTPWPSATQSDSSKSTAPEEKVELWKPEEVEGKIGDYVSARDGFLIVKEPSLAAYEMHVMPLTTPWMIHCGLGFSIDFGSAITGDRSDVENDVRLNFVSSLIPQRVCATVALQVAKRLGAIIDASR